MGVPDSNTDHPDAQLPSARQRTAGWILLSVVAALYLGAILFRLTEFPIYFFTDEAFHAVEGERVLRNGVRGSDGTFFPIYLTAAAGRRTPVFSIYPQGLAAILFGRSVFVTRAVSVVVGAIGILMLSIGVRRAAGLRLWWLLPLAFAAVPAWFLHSRTAFEVAIMVGFTALALGFYLLYRHGAAWWAVPFTVSTFAAFYSYSNGQLIIPVFALLLILSDLRFHLRRWKVWLLCLVLAIPCAWPIQQLLFAKTDGAVDHLRMVGVFQNGDSWRAIAHRYFANYATAFHPRYWFTVSGDLGRHRILEQPHLPLYLAPVIGLGIAVSICRIRESWVRAVLAVAIAAPAAASLAEIGITRVLVMVIPIAVWIMLAVDLLWGVLRWIGLPKVGAFCAFAALLTAVGRVSYQATFEAPLPKAGADYGLYGMQWGAQKLFADVVPRYLRSEPGDSRVHISSDWANAPERFIPFFFDEPERSRVRIADPSLHPEIPRGRPLIFILTPGGMQRLLSSKFFSPPEVLERVPYPDGSDGFFVVRTQVFENAEMIQANERFERSVPERQTVKYRGEELNVRISGLGAGTAQSIFDGDANSLLRGLEANPFFLEITLPEPRVVRGVKFLASPVWMSVELVAANAAATPVANVSATWLTTRAEWHELLFAEPPAEPVKSVWLLITDKQLSDFANIHIWELELL